MIEKLAATRTISPITEIYPPERPAARRAAGLTLPLYAVQLILAYEWLLSGIDKAANPNFGSQVTAMLRQSSLVNPYGWYGSFLKHVVLPHGAFLGPSVVLGELAIGLTLAASAVLWLWRPLALITLVAGAASCQALGGSILLSLNYSFQQGTPLPWIDTAQAFSPGMGIDMLIALLSIPLLAANLRAVIVGQKSRRASH